MKFSCLKNELKKALKPIDKLASVVKEQQLRVDIRVSGGVLLTLSTTNYRMQTKLLTAEIQEGGELTVLHEDLQEVLKKIRRNVMLSFRIIQQPEGPRLMIVTPEGDTHMLDLMPKTEILIEEETLPFLSVGMDDFWPAMGHLTRVLPKKHVMEVFTKAKWVIGQDSIRIVVANQTELAIQHFQTLMAECPQVFYLTQPTMDVLKKGLSAVIDTKLVFETTTQTLKVGGETFDFWLPLERGIDVPIEQLVTQEMTTSSIPSLMDWKEKVDWHVEQAESLGTGITAKNIFFGIGIHNGQAKLSPQQETQRGCFSAYEFLKMFKQETSEGWQCWLPTQDFPILAFVQPKATSTLYLYLLTNGLSA